MIKKRDVWWWHKSNAGIRELNARGLFRPFFQSLIVTEYPKSGGTWLSQLVSECTSLPYARNRYPVFTNSILHGCWLAPHPKHKTIALFRDGRDIMVSYYYHLIFPKDITAAGYSNTVRRKVGIDDPEDITTHLPAFINWAFTEGFPGWSWADYVDRWQSDPRVISTSYEALSINTKQELTNILQQLGIEAGEATIHSAVEKYSFTAQSGRKQGDQDNRAFVRKGIIGDWRNCFNRESALIFSELAGKQLIAAGYEKDYSWIEEV